MVTVAANGTAVALYGLGSMAAARAVGATEWGPAVWFISSTMTLALLSDVLGVYYASAYLFARDRETGDTRDAAHARSSVLLYGLVLGVAVGLLLTCIGPVDRAVFRTLPGLLWGALIVTNLAGTCFTNQARAIFMGESRFGMLGVISLVRSGGFGVLVVGTTYGLHLRTAVHVAACHTIATLLSAVAALVYVMRQGLALPRTSYIRKCMRIGWRGVVVSGGAMVHQRQDQYLVQALLGAKALGIYGLVVSVGELITQVPGMLGLVLFPRASGRDAAAAADRTIRMSLWTLAAAAVIMLPVAALAPVLFRVFFGPSFADAALVLRLYSPSVVFLSAVLIVNAHICGTGYPSFQVATVLTVVALNALLNWLLLPRIGVIAAPFPTG